MLIAPKRLGGSELESSRLGFDASLFLSPAQIDASREAQLFEKKVLSCFGATLFICRSGSGSVKKLFLRQPIHCFICDKEFGRSVCAPSTSPDHVQLILHASLLKKPNVVFCDGLGLKGSQMSIQVCASILSSLATIHTVRSIIIQSLPHLSTLIVLFPFPSLFTISFSTTAANCKLFSSMKEKCAFP